MIDCPHIPVNISEMISLDGTLLWRKHSTTMCPCKTYYLRGHLVDTDQVHLYPSTFN